MIVQYGTYAHDDNECQVTVARQSWRDADGQRRGYTERWNLSGMLRGAGADLVADLTTKIAALKAAYDEDDLDLVLYESDGSTETGHTLKTADTVGGTTVISGPSFPSGRGAEYATYRNYTITIEAKVEDTDNDLISFVEVVSTVGTGDSRFAIHTPLVGAPVVQITAESTPVFVSQDGSAIGRASYPGIPAPVSLSSEHQDRRRVARKSPERLPDGTWRNYEISWHYEFSTVSPSITGSPSFSVGVSAVSHTHDDRYYTETEIDMWRASTTQTEMGYVHGVTSDIQTQLDGKAAVGHDFDTHSGDLDLVDLADYAQGSLIVGGAANWATLAKGTAGQIPMSDGTDLAYSTTFTADMLFTGTTKVTFDDGGSYINVGATDYLDFHWPDDNTGARFYSGANLLMQLRRHAAGTPTQARLVFSDVGYLYKGAVRQMSFHGSYITLATNNRVASGKYIWFTGDGSGYNNGIIWGGGLDAEMYYNGTHLIIDPDRTGSGKVYIGVLADNDIHAAMFALGTTPDWSLTYSTDALYDVNSGVHKFTGGGMSFNSGMQVEQTTITAAATLTAAHYIVLCDTDTAGAAFTATLPAAASHTDRVYYIKNTGTSGFDITVDGNGAETIDGAATQPVADGECLTIVCDGTGWWVI